MGEPAQLSDIKRAWIKQGAAAIVQSVIDDERMPLPFDSVPVHATGECVLLTEVQMFVLELCQEIGALTAELAVAQARVIREKP